MYGSFNSAFKHTIERFVLNTLNRNAEDGCYQTYENNIWYDRIQDTYLCDIGDLNLTKVTSLIQNSYNSPEMQQQILDFVSREKAEIHVVLLLLKSTNSSIALKRLENTIISVDSLIEHCIVNAHRYYEPLITSILDKVSNDKMHHILRGMGETSCSPSLLTYLWERFKCKLPLNIIAGICKLSVFTETEQSITMCRDIIKLRNDRAVELLALNDSLPEQTKLDLIEMEFTKKVASKCRLWLFTIVIKLSTRKSILKVVSLISKLRSHKLRAKALIAITKRFGCNLRIIGGGGVLDNLQLNTREDLPNAYTNHLIKLPLPIWGSNQPASLIATKTEELEQIKLAMYEQMELLSKKCRGVVLLEFIINSFARKDFFAEYQELKNFVPVSVRLDLANRGDNTLDPLLVSDSSYKVREAIARRTNHPFIANMLAEDESELVRLNVAMNTSVEDSSEALIKILPTLKKVRPDFYSGISSRLSNLQRISSQEPISNNSMRVFRALLEEKHAYTKVVINYLVQCAWVHSHASCPEHKRTIAMQCISLLTEACARNTIKKADCEEYTKRLLSFMKWI